ncbi:hypothetical protein GCM10018954_020920 [Kutzneria kofuensis]
MGFGHRVYRAEDPRARVLRRTCRELGAARYEVANALEQAALAELRSRRPDRAIETNVEFWAAVILDFAEVPPHMMPAMFTCARTAGWCAHILEQKRTGRLVRPSAEYIGPAARTPRRSRAGTPSPTPDVPRSPHPATSFRPALACDEKGGPFGCTGGCGNHSLRWSLVTLSPASLRECGTGGPQPGPRRPLRPSGWRR